MANTIRLNTKDISIVNLELCYLFALSRFLQKSLWGAAGFWPRRCFPPSQLQLVVFVFMLTQLVLDHTVCVTFVTELRCTYFFTKSARVAVLSTWAAVAVAIWTYFVCIGQNLIQLERYVLAWYVLACFKSAPVAVLSTWGWLPRQLKLSLKRFAVSSELAYSTARWRSLLF